MLLSEKFLQRARTRMRSASGAACGVRLPVSGMLASNKLMADGPLLLSAAWPLHTESPNPLDRGVQLTQSRTEIVTSASARAKASGDSPAPSLPIITAQGRAKIGLHQLRSTGARRDSRKQAQAEAP